MAKAGAIPCVRKSAQAWLLIRGPRIDHGTLVIAVNEPTRRDKPTYFRPAPATSAADAVQNERAGLRPLGVKFHGLLALAHAEYQSCSTRGGDLPHDQRGSASRPAQ
jgi:hypothetical protein